MVKRWTKTDWKHWLYILLFFAGDFISIAGVALFDWNVMRIMLFYWLDTAIMVLFMVMVLKTAFDRPWNPGMVLATMPILFITHFTAIAIFFLGESMGYPVGRGESKWEILIKPYSHFIFMVCVIAAGYIQEYILFVHSENPEKKIMGIIKTFTWRFFSVHMLGFAGMYLCAVLDFVDIRIIPLVLIFFIKIIVLKIMERND